MHWPLELFCWLLFIKFLSAYRLAWIKKVGRPRSVPYYAVSSERCVFGTVGLSPGGWLGFLSTGPRLNVHSIALRGFPCVLSVVCLCTLLFHPCLKSGGAATFYPIVSLPVLQHPPSRRAFSAPRKVGYRPFFSCDVCMRLSTGPTRLNV